MARLNGCLNFNGVNNYVQISNIISADFSIAFWVKTTQTGGAGQWYNGAGLVDGDSFRIRQRLWHRPGGGQFGFGVGNPGHDDCFNQLRSMTAPGINAWPPGASNRGDQRLC